MKTRTRQPSVPNIAGELTDLDRGLDGRADLVIAYMNVSAGRPVAVALRAWAGDASILAATSCSGIMTESGPGGFGAPGAAILAIADQHGADGTGFAAYGDDPLAAGVAAVHALSVITFHD